MSHDLSVLTVARVFDGGDLDCGSGLVLLIREHMLATPVGDVLEMRSREPTVADDLPPWCRMAGHDYLGSLPLGDRPEDGRRFFIRRGEVAASDDKELESDKARAKSYEWRARVRVTGPQKSTVYCRNFAFEVGQPASFEEKDAAPCAVEYVLGALAAALATGFATECGRDGLEVDDVEISARGTLVNVLAHLGLENGDPGFARIEARCFASTFADEGRVRAAWERTVTRSPIAATLAKGCELALTLAIV